MCGRFDIHSAIEIIAKLFGVEAGDILIELAPNYNVAPSNTVPIVVKGERKQLVPARWGFIPSWAKEEKAGYSLINARAETVAEKPVFRDAFQKQRCLVIADGFYEWQTIGNEKRPVYVHLRSGAPMGFAGLYSTWRSPRDNATITTCTILVMNADELLKPVHDRMPVILDPASRDRWLDPAVHGKEDVLSLLKPCSSNELELYPVSSKVNSPKNNDAGLIGRIDTDREYR